MTTRSQDRPPQGTEPDARKTTQQSMIAAIGASGAVLASGVTTFVLLVGVVSFDVWPMSDAAGPGSGTDGRLVELSPEPAADAQLTAVDPFGSGALVTDPATVALAGEPAGRPDRPKLAGNRDVDSGAAPPTPVAQVPGGGADEAPAGGGDDGVTVGAGAEEPIPVEPVDEGEADHDDANGRPQRPSRPARPAPTPAPSPTVASGTATAPDTGGSDSSGGAGGSGSSGNGNHGGRG